MRVGATGVTPHVPRQSGFKPPHPTQHVITKPGEPQRVLLALPRTVGSDKTRYVTLGADTDAPDGHCAHLSQYVTNAMRCTEVVRSRDVLPRARRKGEQKRARGSWSLDVPARQA